MKGFALTALTIFLTFLSGAIGLLTAPYGAKTAGFVSNEWSLEVFIYVIEGFIAGLLGFLALFHLISRKRRLHLFVSMAIALVCLIPLTFVTGMVGYKINNYSF
jgi:uncharacterized membrane protein YjjP (DUF1212 family)